jgi:hypothetical protein
MTINALQTAGKNSDIESTMSPFVERTLSRYQADLPDFH